MSQECTLKRDAIAKLPCDQWGATVTIKVGRNDALEPQKSWAVHKGLLCHYSLYFKTRMNGNWGEQKEIELDDADAATFGAFVCFIYRGQLWDSPVQASTDATPSASASAASTTVTTTAIPFTVMGLARIYVFADRFIVPLLKCAATDAMCGLFASLQSRKSAIKIMKFVGDNTREPCGLRLLCLDYYTQVLGYTSSQKWSERMRRYRKYSHPDFLFEIASRLYDQREAAEPQRLKHPRHFAERDMCQYHDHRDVNDDATTKRLEYPATVLGTSSFEEGKKTFKRSKPDDTADDVDDHENLDLEPQARQRHKCRKLREAIGDLR